MHITVVIVTLFGLKWIFWCPFSWMHSCDINIYWVEMCHGLKSAWRQLHISNVFKPHTSWDWRNSAVCNAKNNAHFASVVDDDPSRNNQFHTIDCLFMANEFITMSTTNRKYYWEKTQTSIFIFLQGYLCLQRKCNNLIFCTARSTL